MAAPIQGTRLVFWFTPHGTVYEDWAPSGTEREFKLGPILSPLERHQQRLTVLDGLRVLDEGPAGAHTRGLPLLWTASPLQETSTFISGDSSYGWNTGPSVDQFIVSRQAFDTPYSSLQFGVRTGSSHPGRRMIYRDAEAPLEPEADPWKGLARLMGSADTTGEEAQRLAERRLSALDLVSDQLERVRELVSTNDRFKIEAHLEALRNVEIRLQNPTEMGTCTAPELEPAVNAGLAANMPTILENMSSVLATSLSCDLARVASLQYSVGENDGGFLYDWLEITRGDHHAMSHLGDGDAEGQADLIKIYTWYADRFAQFLDKLDAIPEGDGTVLDNTLVVWGSEIGKGNNHSFERVPFVLAGGAAGRLEMGRYLKFDNVEHNRLLVTLCHLMGADSVNTFGATDTGSGGLRGLDIAT